MTSLYPNASFISCHASYKNCIFYFHVSRSVKLGGECYFDFDALLNAGNFDGLEGHVLHISRTVLQELSYSYKHWLLLTPFFFFGLLLVSVKIPIMSLNTEHCFPEPFCLCSPALEHWKVNTYWQGQTVCSKIYFRQCQTVCFKIYFREGQTVHHKIYFRQGRTVCHKIYFMRVIQCVTKSTSDRVRQWVTKSTSDRVRHCVTKCT